MEFWGWTEACSLDHNLKYSIYSSIWGFIDKPSKSIDKPSRDSEILGQTH